MRLLFADRVYAFDSSEAFEEALLQSAEALAPYQTPTAGATTGASPCANATVKRRWFRPPSGVMSAAMAGVLARHGYSAVLGDVFSNDVLVGGTHAGGPAGPATVAYHVAYSAQRTRPGSVAIFHVPQAAARLATAEIVRGYAAAVRARGWRLVTVTELAAAVEASFRAPGDVLKTGAV